LVSINLCLYSNSYRALNKPPLSIIGRGGLRFYVVGFRGMKKTLYIIPGFGESTRMTPYPKIVAIAKSNGYRVVTYNPKWSRGVATSWINNFKKVLAHETSRHVTVLGFSFGAYIAINTAKDFYFQKIIACSLSPFFKDDIKYISPSARRFLGKRRIRDFVKYSFPRGSKSEAVFMVGEKEITTDFYPENIDRRYREWSGKKKKIVVANAEHDIASGDYLQAIKKELR
jgi:pimeloyl-ACP methyl ester carboxylesterase